MGGVVYTIGHSAHSADRLRTLVRGAGGSVVVDVRSSPWSRHHPQHAKNALRAHLVAGGLRYEFRGTELGGRPTDDQFFDGDGRVRYDRVAATEVFADGIQFVRDLVTLGERPVLLCAEEDPQACHRRLLVGRVLEELGMAIIHIRGDGRQEREGDQASQLSIFAEWVSTLPVRRGST